MKNRGAGEGLTRTERDELGAMEVPFEALYGVQTARAMRNFSDRKSTRLNSSH